MTLSPGTILASELNTEFAANNAAIATNSSVEGKNFQVEVDVLDLTSATPEGSRTTFFTVPDDYDLTFLALSVWSPDTTSRTITVSLSAVDSDGVDIPSYTGNVEVRITSAVSTTGNSQGSQSYLQEVVLVRGITYRLTVLSNAGTAEDRVTGIAVLTARRRRA